MSRHCRTVFCGTFLSLGLALAGQATATILTFETPWTAGGENVGNWNTHYNLSPSLDAYGDDVDYGAASTGSTPVGIYTFNYSRAAEGWTPNVTVDYGVEAGTGPGPDGVGRVVDPSNPWLSGVAWLDSDTNTPHLPRKFYFIFTPDAGYEVRVNSYDLIGYSFGIHGHEVTIYKDSVAPGNEMVNTYAEASTEHNPSTPKHYDLTTALDPSEFYAGTVILQLDHRSGAADWTLALDNLAFEQRLIPEPAALGMIAVAGLMLARRRRR